MNEYIKSDLYRGYGKTDLITFFYAFMFDSGFNYMFWLRMCQCGGLRKLICLPIHKWKRSWGKINIGYKCKIGYGLYIGHGGPCVVSDSAVLGDNCNLSQFVSIGSNFGKAAMIGNNVYIGPGVSIVENVLIGDNVTIGAGAVVVKDIISNSTVVGNPAKIVKSSTEPIFIKNIYKKK